MVTTFAPDEVGLADKSPCAGIRADLKMCLLASDCCKKDKKTPRECLREGSVPEECAQLRQTFFECKRSLVYLKAKAGPAQIGLHLRKKKVLKIRHIIINLITYFIPLTFLAFLLGSALLLISQDIIRRASDRHLTITVQNNKHHPKGIDIS